VTAIADPNRVVAIERPPRRCHPVRR
jgi:hypothetical protein